MNETTIHADAAATLTRLLAKHGELKQELAQAWGFAVFPYVGRASAVLGGAYGQGEVFEQGKSIGFATISQMTVGVQVGGQTFSELVIFPKKESLKQFRTGMVAFTANASAVIVKAAASGTTNFDGVTAHAYSRGGMLLELSLGGQKFMFIPPAKPLEGIQPRQQGAGESDEKRASGDSEDAQASGESEVPEEGAVTEAEEAERRASEGSDGGEEEDDPPAGQQVMKGLKHLGSKKGLKHLGSKIVGKAREVGGHLPILKKEAEINRRLHVDSIATLMRMKAKDESLVKQLEEAYAYAVYPTVGKASLVLGCSYGKGEVFRHGKLDGYAGLVQVTLGVQVGGQTYSELVLFQDEDALKRFRQGKLGWAANLSAVIVKAGAAATNNYKQGMQIYVHSEGGLAVEAVIGGQKLIYRHAGLMRGKPADQDPALDLGRGRPAVEQPSPAS